MISWGMQILDPLQMILDFSIVRVCSDPEDDDWILDIHSSDAAKPETVVPAFPHNWHVSITYLDLVVG